MSYDQILNLPPTADLPAQLHGLAADYESACERVAQLEDQISSLGSAMVSAERADAEALKKAALAGKALPKSDSVSPLSRQRELLAPALDELRAERAMAESALAMAFRDPAVKAHLVAALKPRAEAAADAYADALADAHAKLSAAARSVAEATQLLGTIEAINDGHEITTGGAAIALPNFSSAHSSLSTLAERLASAVASVPSPRDRRIRKADGRELTLSTEFAAQLYGREPIEFIDGYPAPEPVRPYPSETAALSFYLSKFGGKDDGAFKRVRFTTPLKLRGTAYRADDTLVLSAELAAKLVSDGSAVAA